VEIDGAGTEEQGRGDLAVGQPFRDEGSDLRLLRREGHAGGSIPFPSGLTGGPQFLLRPLRPRLGAQVVEGLQRGPQLLPGIDPAAGPAQEFTVGEVGAGTLIRPVRATFGFESEPEEFFGGDR